MTIEDTSLRSHLLDLLRGSGAHVDVLSALAGLPPHLRGKRPPGAPHSAWELLEHIRFTLHDLLDYCVNPHYREPAWPRDYWPHSAEPATDLATDQDWCESVTALEADLAEFERLIRNPRTDLFAAIPWAKAGHTPLREVLLAADHTSYHTGELVYLRRLLGAWKG